MWVCLLRFFFFSLWTLFGIMGIKWDFNLLVFVVWKVFNYLCFFSNFWVFSGFWLFLLCLVFLWFCLCVQFLPDFSLFLEIVLGYFCCWLQRMLGIFRFCIFSSSLILLGVFILLIPTLYLLVLLDILSGVGLCVILWGVFFFRFLSVIIVCILRASE